MAAVILYNKLLLDLDLEKIHRDFIVYRVAKETGYFEKSIFDLPTVDLKARSVVYERGNSFYILFDKKHVPDARIRDALAAQAPEARVKQLSFAELSVAPKHIITQLLFNSLYSCDNTKGSVKYNNVSGGLFYLVEDKHSFLVMLQIKLTQDMLLKLDIATFSKRGKYDGESDEEKKRLDAAPRYRYDLTYKRLISLSREDAFPKSESYIRRSFSAKKNNKAFLDFNRLQPQKYEDSKVGVFCKFMQDVGDQLKEYIFNIHLDVLPEYQEFVPDDQKIVLDWSQAQKNGINFVNLLKTKRSATMRKVEKIVQDQYGIPVTRGAFRKDAFNVIFIHDKEYYEAQTRVDKGTAAKQKDPHQTAYPGVVQHVTLENYLEIGDERQIQLATKKVIQDLLIKHDIYRNRLSLVHWESQHSWTFVIAGEKEGANPRRYYKMTIHPTKALTFESFTSLDLFPEGSENQRIQSSFFSFERKYGGWYRIEGLFYQEDGSDNVFALSKTDAYTMPLYEEVDRMMKATKPTCELSKETISRELNAFLCQSGEKIKEEDISLMKSNLERCPGNIITISSLVKDISIGSKLIQGFNKYLIKIGSTPLTPDFKVGENKEKYFGGFVGIKYYMKDACLHYFVGTKSDKDIQTSFSKRCLIRRLDSVSGDIPAGIATEFFRYLTVDFIRENQYTVLPFQFKYLREYVNMLKIAESSMNV